MANILTLINLSEIVEKNEIHRLSSDESIWSTLDLFMLPIFILFIITGVFGNCLVCLAIYTTR